MSLSTWFRDYLYIPLGGNRVSKARTILNLFLVFLATGIWHGAAWVFVVWGLWHGAFIILEKLTGWQKVTGGVFIRLLQHGYAMLVVVVGWVFFRSETLTYAVDYIGTMFGLAEAHPVAFTLKYYLDRQAVLAFAAAVLCSLPLFRGIIMPAPGRPIPRALANLWLFILFLLAVTEMAASTYNPFIYFRF